MKTTSPAPGPQVCTQTIPRELEKEKKKPTTGCLPEVSPEHSSSMSRDDRSAFLRSYIKSLSIFQCYLITYNSYREMTDFYRRSTDWVEGSTGCNFPSFDFEQLKRRGQCRESDWSRLRRLKDAVAGRHLFQSFSHESNIQTP